MTSTTLENPSLILNPDVELSVTQRMTALSSTLTETFQKELMTLLGEWRIWERGSSI